MKPIRERVLEVLRTMGSMTFSELLMGTVRAFPTCPDASLPALEKALDDLRDHNLIELKESRFDITKRGEK